MKRVLIAAGGSGGHLLPAQQLARKLHASHDSEVLFAGGGLFGSRFFDREEFFFEEISSSSIKRSIFSLFNMGWKIFRGIFQSIRLIRRYQPDVVVGFGSYHSFPVLVGAWVMRKPLVLFEANCLLGKVNRIFAKRAKKVAVQFPIGEGAEYAYVPFLPWGEKLKRIHVDDAKGQLNLSEDLFTLLSFGGSQGAVFINDLMLDVCSILKETGVAFQVVHLTGNREEEVTRVRSHYERKNIPHLVKSYEENMSLLLSMADVAVCRSGASSVAEMLFYQLPSILIPYPHSADGHQEMNAKFFEEIGGGHMFLQKEADANKVADLIVGMIEDNKKIITDMKNKISQYYREESQKRDKEISEIVMEIAGE